MGGKIIFFIGFMGAGKTTIGKRFAQAYDYQFVDADQALEALLNTTVKTIFDLEGEEAFRNYEADWLKGLSVQKDTVVALGGGTPCFKSNMELIKKRGVSFYLKTDVAVLVDRLIQTETARPVIDFVKHDKEQLKRLVKSILAEREPFYKQADFTVDSETISMDQLQEKLNI